MSNFLRVGDRGLGRRSRRLRVAEPAVALVALAFASSPAGVAACGAGHQAMTLAKHEPACATVHPHPGHARCLAHPPRGHKTHPAQSG